MSKLRRLASVLPRRWRAAGREFLEKTLDARMVPAKPLFLAGLELDILDLVLTHYRQTHPDVFFMQVGAFDGASGDPMFHLVKKHGMKGALVEPQGEAFRRLKANYGSLGEESFVFVNAAMGAEDGKRPLYSIKSGANCPAWLHQNASFKKEHLQRLAGSVPNIELLIQEEEVSCLTFGSLFREAGIRHVDLLAVDTEGYDAEILRLFDVPARKPAIIQYEHSHLRRQEQEECLASLASQGYRVAIGDSDTIAYDLSQGEKPVAGRFNA